MHCYKIFHIQMSFRINWNDYIIIVQCNLQCTYIDNPPRWYKHRQCHFSNRYFLTVRKRTICFLYIQTDKPTRNSGDGGLLHLSSRLDHRTIIIIIILIPIIIIIVIIMIPIIIIIVIIIILVIIFISIITITITITIIIIIIISSSSSSSSSNIIIIIIIIYRKKVVKISRDFPFKLKVLP